MPIGRILLLAAFLSIPGLAGAQQQPARPAPVAAPSLTPPQQAAIRGQDAEMGKAARQVLALIDANRAGEVWDGASAVVKRLVPREEFIRQVELDRDRLGKPVERGTPVITRSRFGAGGQVPEGFYTNVATPTAFERSAGPERELVSFRLDEDRTWRVSGYSVR